MHGISSVGGKYGSKMNRKVLYRLGMCKNCRVPVLWGFFNYSNKQET